MMGRATPYPGSPARTREVVVSEDKLNVRLVFLGHGATPHVIGHDTNKDLGLRPHGLVTPTMTRG